MARTRRARGRWLTPRASLTPADVLAALADLGVEILHVTGDEATGRCVMHYERTGKYDAHPSWSCNVDTGVFNCFSCGYKGVFTQLVCDVLGVDWDEATDWVRARGGIERVNRILGRHEHVDSGLPEQQAERVYTEADLALFTLPPAEALRKRGLTAASCRTYGVLWDPDRDMWITPIRDPAGRLLGWQEKNERYFYNRPFSMEKSKTLFGFHILPPGGTAVLVESPLDCLRMASVGVHGAVSSYGAGVSDAQMQLLFDHSHLIVIALDNDRDGRKYAAELRARYRGMGRRLAFYNYGDSDAKDPGEQSGDEIRFGVAHALSTVRVRGRLAA